jgi:CMP-N,N'-diacetyllegionaminic acid synthase
VALLQPTNPLRRPEDIDGCLELLEKSAADCVVTILPVPAEFNPHWVYFTSPSGELRLSTGEPSPITRRQDLPPAFHREGSVYAVRTATVLEGSSLYGRRVLGYPLDPERCVNIDGPRDWERAEALLARRGATKAAS